MQRRPGLAYQLAARVTEIDPSKSIGWQNLGMMAENLYRFDEAEECFRKSEARAKDDREKAGLYLNWASCKVAMGDWPNAEKMARRALRYSPDSIKASLNLGLALLAMGQYREGWPLYDAIIGFDPSRRFIQYRNELTWDGSKGKRLVVWAEQGLGDEISFASMLPDVIRDSEAVTFDCTAKLAGLFRRSFPSIKVHGTSADNRLTWDPGEIEAGCSIGGLGKFYRNDKADFPGTPYLVADPDRVAMWRGLFAKQGRPVYGIAWSGGTPWTADRFRRWKLEDLLPLFQARDAVWVSLEYKDATAEIAAFKSAHPEIDIRQYAYGTLTQDYDDTAALVEALDGVVAMQTAVVHLCGALGKRCLAFVNRYSQWRYGVPGQATMDWYKSVRLFRQSSGAQWPLESALAFL